MNIVHFVGNGFDINLGLKTSFLDFLRYYRRLSSYAPVIYNFKQHLTNEKLENWSNLEIELGKYTCNLTTFGDSEELRQDIILALSKYLRNIQNKFDIELLDKFKILNLLNAPYLDLVRKDFESIKTFGYGLINIR